LLFYDEAEEVKTDRSVVVFYLRIGRGFVKGGIPAGVEIEKSS
jgi:hypothetical protein